MSGEPSFGLASAWHCGRKSWGLSLVWFWVPLWMRGWNKQKPATSWSTEHDLQSITCFPYRHLGKSGGALMRLNPTTAGTILSDPDCHLRKFFLNMCAPDKILSEINSNNKILSKINSSCTILSEINSSNKNLSEIDCSQENSSVGTSEKILSELDNSQEKSVWICLNSSYSFFWTECFLKIPARTTSNPTMGRYVSLTNMNENHSGRDTSQKVKEMNYFQQQPDKCTAIKPPDIPKHDKWLSKQKTCRANTINKGQNVNRRTEAREANGRETSLLTTSRKHYPHPAGWGQQI